MILLGLAAGVSIPPTITVSSSTNFNQNSGVLNAVVNTTGNRSVVSVEFQYSTSSTFASGNSAWFAATVNTTISQGATSTARSCSVTGLTPSTVSVPVYYYVRARATNASGFVTTSSIGGSFKTYTQRTSTFTGSSTWSNPVPTSGTSGLAITSISDLFVVAGGAGREFFRDSGAGGGGVQTSSSISIGSSVAVTIGAGGSDGADGSASSIAGSSTLSASGGLRAAIAAFERGGTSGNGYLGGVVGPYSGAGGGGAGGIGADGGTGGSIYNGGDGGIGISGYGIGGGGTADYGGVNGTPYTDGPANSGQGSAGGNNISLSGNGGSGYATFKYWGP